MLCYEEWSLGPGAPCGPVQSPIFSPASLLPLGMCCQSFLPFCSHPRIFTTRPLLQLSEALGILCALLHLSHFCGVVLALTSTCSTLSSLSQLTHSPVLLSVLLREHPICKAFLSSSLQGPNLSICALHTLACIDYALLWGLQLFAGDSTSLSQTCLSWSRNLSYV